MVDPESGAERLPEEVGEIWIGGLSVTAGYWGREEESGRLFRAPLASRGGTFLRTGDLGVLNGAGLLVTGRLKDLIIIRGRNHYPQDIEATAEGYVAGIFKSAALPVEERSTTKTSGDGLYEVYAGVPVVCSTTCAPSSSTAVRDIDAGSAFAPFADSAAGLAGSFF